MKYDLYGEAVYRALLDRKEAAGAASTSASGSASGTSSSKAAGKAGGDVPMANMKPVVLMVVGAGRGPLVRASMKASQRAGVPLKVYAVEKNPNALIHIEQMIQSEGWQQQVTLVSADMRHWQVRVLHCIT